jgi:hypothetical protein
MSQPPERQTWEDLDWGGDGSDLNNPVRAHVLEALVLTDEPYPEPVDALRRLGHPDDAESERQRSALELTQEHVPDLVRMARDRALYAAAIEDLEGWAPIHAIYALQALDVSQVVEQLIPLFDVENEWYDSELPRLVASAGVAALEPARRYFLDETRWYFARTRIADVFEHVGKNDPELRPKAIEMLSEALQNYARNDEMLNGFIIDSLVELKAEEALPLIRQAFEANAVDESVRGDWEAIMRDMGQEPDPDDPLIAESARRKEARYQQMQQMMAMHRLQQMSSAAPAEAPSSAPPAGGKSKQGKAKQKRKQEKASRKANRPKSKKKKR